MAQRQFDGGKRVLLMGRSGSGKSSMKSLIFANMAPSDTRRIGATIDIDQTKFVFLGDFELSLWDCGGQDSYMSSYLAPNRRSSVFSQVGTLLYIFDVESADFSGVDMIWFGRNVASICEYMSAGGLENFNLHVLIHKMDLVPIDSRARVLESKAEEVRIKVEEASQGKISLDRLHVFGTSIWDETIYRAWSSIMQTLVPEIALLDAPLEKFAQLTSACEAIIIEKATSLVVARYSEFAPAPTSTKALTEGAKGASGDSFGVMRRGRAGARRDGETGLDESRFETMSSIVKAFKRDTAQRHQQFRSLEITHPMYTAVLDSLSPTTSILVVATDPKILPAAIHLNIDLARPHFAILPGLSGRRT